MANQAFYNESGVIPTPAYPNANQEQNATVSAQNLVYQPNLALVQNMGQPIATLGHNFTLTATINPNLAGFSYSSAPIKVQDNSTPGVMPSTLPTHSSIYFIPTDHPIPEFLHQLTKMLSDNENSSMISWIDKRIVVHDPPGLTTKVFHKYFRHSNYASFQRQLNYFGFRKVTGKKGKMHPCSYVHDHVTSDLRSLLAIKRKNTKKSASKINSSSNVNAEATSTPSSNANAKFPAIKVTQADVSMASEGKNTSRPLHSIVSSSTNLSSTDPLRQPPVGVDAISNTSKSTITPIGTTQLALKRNSNGSLKLTLPQRNSVAIKSDSPTSILSHVGSQNEKHPLSGTTTGNGVENPLKRQRLVHNKTDLQPSLHGKKQSNTNFGDLIMDPKTYASLQVAQPVFPELMRPSLLESRKNRIDQALQGQRVDTNDASKVPVIPYSDSLHVQDTAPQQEKLPAYESSLSMPTLPLPTLSLDQSHFEFMDLEKDLRSLGNYFQFYEDANQKKNIDNQASVFTPREVFSCPSGQNINPHQNITEQVTHQEQAFPQDLSNLGTTLQHGPTENTSDARDFMNNTNHTSSTSFSQLQSDDGNLYNLDDLDGFSFSFSKEKSFDTSLMKNVFGGDELKPGIPTTIKHDTNSRNSLVQVGRH